MHRISFILIASLLLGCCAGREAALAPRNTFAPPSPAHWAGQDAGAGQNEDADPLVSAGWLAQFHDEGISALVAEALAKNHDLAAAAARVQQVQALAKTARAGRWPALSIGANRTDTVLAGAPNIPNYTANISSSWELDVWGRLHDQVRAATYDVAAASIDLNGLRLLIAGQSVAAWVDLIAAGQQETLAQDDVQTRTHSANIVQRRYRLGVSSSLDVRLARAALANARAGAALQTQQRENAARRLEVLLGRYPAQEIKSAHSLPQLSPLRTLGAPADILQNRPDIQSAEQRIHAAGLRVSAARKAFLPSFRFTGSATNQGSNLGDMFDFSSVLGRLAGSVSQPVFRGGAIAAQVNQNQAAKRESIEIYAQTVLEAYREVEDALFGQKHLMRRELALLDAVEQAAAAKTLVTREYARGIGTIFQVLEAQRTHIVAQGQLISARRLRVQSRINLYLALGAQPFTQENTTATESKT